MAIHVLHPALAPDAGAPAAFGNLPLSDRLSHFSHHLQKHSANPQCYHQYVKAKYKHLFTPMVAHLQRHNKQLRCLSALERLALQHEYEAEYGIDGERDTYWHHIKLLTAFEIQAIVCDMLSKEQHKPQTTFDADLPKTRICASCGQHVDNTCGCWFTEDGETILPYVVMPKAVAKEIWILLANGTISNVDELKTRLQSNDVIQTGTMFLQKRPYEKLDKEIRAYWSTQIVPQLAMLFFDPAAPYNKTDFDFLFAKIDEYNRPQSQCNTLPDWNVFKAFVQKPSSTAIAQVEFPTNELLTGERLSALEQEDDFLNNLYLSYPITGFWRAKSFINRARLDSSIVKFFAKQLDILISMEQTLTNLFSDIRILLNKYLLSDVNVKLRLQEKKDEFEPRVAEYRKIAVSLFDISTILYASEEKELLPRDYIKEHRRLNRLELNDDDKAWVLAQLNEYKPLRVALLTASSVKGLDENILLQGALDVYRRRFDDKYRQIKDRNAKQKEDAEKAAYNAGQKEHELSTVNPIRQVVLVDTSLPPSRIQYKWSPIYSATGTCPWDSLFVALFKLSGSWLENYIFNAKTVYPQRYACRGYEADMFHETILKDINYLHDTTIVNMQSIQVAQLWNKCVGLDIDPNNSNTGQDPRAVFSFLLRFYNVPNSAYGGSLLSAVTSLEIALKPDDSEKEMLLFPLVNPTESIVWPAPLELENLFTLTSVITYRPGHYVAHVRRDPLSEIFYEFDGTKTDGELRQHDMTNFIGKPVLCIYNRKQTVVWKFLTQLIIEELELNSVSRFEALVIDFQLRVNNDAKYASWTKLQEFARQIKPREGSSCSAEFLKFLHQIEGQEKDAVENFLVTEEALRIKQCLIPNFAFQQLMRIFDAYPDVSDDMIEELQRTLDALDNTSEKQEIIDYAVQLGLQFKN